MKELLNACPMGFASSTETLCPPTRWRVGLCWSRGTARDNVLGNLDMKRVGSRASRRWATMHLVTHRCGDQIQQLDALTGSAHAVPRLATRGGHQKCFEACKVDQRRRCLFQKLSAESKL